MADQSYMRRRGSSRCGEVCVEWRRCWKISLFLERVWISVGWVQVKRWCWVSAISPQQRHVGVVQWLLRCMWAPAGKVSVWNLQIETFSLRGLVPKALSIASQFMRAKVASSVWGKVLLTFHVCIMRRW